MSQKVIEAAVSAVVQLIAFLLEARKNGQLSDEQLRQLTASTNQKTRELIRQALAGPERPA